MNLHLGENTDYRTLNTKKLLKAFADSDSYDLDIVREICYRADMLEDFEESEDEFEIIIDQAITKLTMDAF